MFHRAFRLCLPILLAILFMPAAVRADPSDIDAASRGVVRIVIMEQQNGELYPVAHGTGFAVSPERIVTNAHVVSQAKDDPTMAIGIVPSDGGKAVYGRLAAYSSRNDLALIATTAPMKLPPLTIATNVDPNAGSVSAVGYPMNVDRAQGLGVKDIFKAQPPVKSQGFLSGRRPSRDFDTLLHTAPIGRGSSGGPLLDSCGRVVGVNSFGAESGSADSEFYFAVSTRELLPFLVANGIAAQTNGLPCRSMAELDAQERARTEQEQIASLQQQESKQAQAEKRAEQARRETTFAIIAERENGMMLSVLLVIGGIIAGGAFVQLRKGRDMQKAKIAGAIAGIAIAGALASWLLRPGFGDIDDRVAQALAKDDKSAQGRTGNIPISSAQEQATKLVCVVDVERSRITTGETNDVPLSWRESGCVNERTQYGLIDGKWSRIFVPQNEAAVSVSSYDPGKREYRVERYLLAHDAMDAVRKARATYQTPECNTGPDAAAKLGSSQAAIAALLPSQPNERIVYKCGPPE